VAVEAIRRQQTRLTLSCLLLNEQALLGHSRQVVDTLLGLSQCRGSKHLCLDVKALGL
jgi:hypothetical protein